MRIAGMMSGTSFDAIDVAVAEFDQRGEVLHCRPYGMISRRLDRPVRDRIAAVLPPNPTTVEQVCRLDTELGQLFGAVAAEAIAEFGTVDLVVCHGQTVFHWVRERTAQGTLQLGCPAWIAEATSAAVLSDLRSRDISRGGQGAPLAPTLDDLLVLSDQVRRGALNLGGIANISVRDPDLIGYDLGPANALIDSAVAQATDGAERMDTGGRRAARGTVQPSLLARLLAEPYYALAPPKSTGKELFHPDYLATMVDDHERPVLDDLVATLTELTARLVADACHRHQLAELAVSGGGAENPTLMGRISALCHPTTVRPFSDFGIPGPAKEAYLMALVGYLSWHGMPTTTDSATGATAVLGSLTPGAGPLTLPTESVPRPQRMIIDDQ